MPSTESAGRVRYLLSYDLKADKGEDRSADYKALAKWLKNRKAQRILKSQWVLDCPPGTKPDHIKQLPSRGSMATGGGQSVEHPVNPLLDLRRDRLLVVPLPDVVTPDNVFQKNLVNSISRLPSAPRKTS